MSGYNDLKKCPVCRTENSLAISGDWKPYDYEHGHCHECGFTHQTKFYRMTLEQLNDYRKHLNEIYEEGLEPLKSLPFPEIEPASPQRPEDDVPYHEDPLFEFMWFKEELDRPQPKSLDDDKVRKSVANDRSILKSMEEEKEIEEGFIREEMRMSEK